MKLQDLDFSYPEELVATEPVRPSRVLWTALQSADGRNFTGIINDKLQVTSTNEITVDDLLARIPAGDILVINNTKVLKRRVFAEQGGSSGELSNELEILFLTETAPGEWLVLFPSRKYNIGDEIMLPQGLKMTLLEKGRPQKVRLSQPVTEKYFDEVAELPLPPYIQKARGLRHNQKSDEKWYQTDWAHKAGSFAAPTASLHLTKENLQTLRTKGVHVLEITLHVGLGTFLPVQAENLKDHVMHEEVVEISPETWSLIHSQKQKGHHVWALGTTVTRALESAAKGLLTKTAPGGFVGGTQLMILPGFEWQVVDRLLTNFHQPKSTLLALVAGFSCLETVHRVYMLAIQKKMRLFSYGDLSVWVR